MAKADSEAGHVEADVCVVATGEWSLKAREVQEEEHRGRGSLAVKAGC